MQNLRHLFVVAAYIALNSLSVQAQPSPPTPQIVSKEVQEPVRGRLTTAPEGFQWRQYRSAVFVKPSEWNEQEQVNENAGITYATYAASPEVFSRVKPFEMGMTIQIVSGGQKAKGLEANKVVLMLLAPIVTTHKKEDVLMFEQGTAGDFEKTYFRYRDEPTGKTPIVVHKFILANKVLDSVHVFTFESPKQSWDENWKQFGTAFMSKVNLAFDAPDSQK